MSLHADHMVVYAVGAAGAAADSSFSTMSLIAFAANKPSVRNAGLVGSMPTNTMVGKPCICNMRHRTLMQPGNAQGNVLLLTWFLAELYLQL